MASNKIIFISCGQQTEEEKALGKAVMNLVNATPGFEGYYAQEVHSPESLAKHIFDALGRCSGFIAFLHDRGIFRDKKGEEGRVSSVWINQEIAILAYRQLLKSVKIPFLVFKDERVKIQGAMSSLIINPQPLQDRATTEIEVRKWLDRERFAPSVQEEIFRNEWARLSPVARQVLSALVDLGGGPATETSIRRNLCDRYGFSSNDASRALKNVKGALGETSLVDTRFTDHGDSWTIHPDWDWYIRRAIASAAKS